MSITLRQLRYFEALVAERHFGRAAARVSVSQPALSGQIRELEAALGGAVVERGTPGLALTPLGREVAARAAAVLGEVRALEAAARAAEGLGAPLRLGLIPTVAPYLVPPFLPLLRTRGGRAEIREAVTATLLDELDGGRLDAAVVALPPPERGYHAEPLFEERFLLATPEGAPAGPLPRRPEEIDPDALMLLDEGHCLADQALSACRLGPERRRLRVGAASLGTLARLVASGQGVTLIPEIAARAEGQGLRLSRFAAPEPGRTIGLLRPARGEPPGWFMTLATLLGEAARAIPRPGRAGGAAEPGRGPRVRGIGRQ